MAETTAAGALPDARVPGWLGRVLAPGGEPVGTCFQVAPGLLVTAWHVTAGLGCGEPGSRVVTDTLSGAAAGAGHTEVVAADPARDLVVLRRDAPLPDTVPGWVPTDDLRPFAEVCVTGVAEVRDHHAYRYLDAPGTWSGGTVRDGEVALGRLTCSAVLPGMSGAPVLRRGGRYVAGVVSARYNSEDGWLRDSVWVIRTEDLTRLLRTVPGTALRTRLVAGEEVAGEVAVVTAFAGAPEPSPPVAGPLEAALEAAAVLAALDAAARGAAGPGLARVLTPWLDRAAGAAGDPRRAAALRRRVRERGLDARLLLPGMARHREALRRWSGPLPGPAGAAGPDGGDGVAGADGGPAGREAFLDAFRRALARELRGPLFGALSDACRAYLAGGLLPGGSPAAGAARFLEALDGALPVLRATSVEAVLVTRPTDAVASGAAAGSSPRQAGMNLVAAQMCRLPRPDPCVAGRDELVAEVAGAVRRRSARGPGTVAFLSGQPGVGTSTVAVEAARRLAPDFPGGVYHVDLHGLVPGARRDARTVVRMLSAALGLGPPGEALGDEELFALFTAGLAGRRVLLVLDNARDAAHAGPLVGAAGDGAVIVTSRDREQSHADPRLVFEVPPLARAASVEVLDRCGAGGGDDRAPLDRLAHLCADVPLALRLVGARLAGRPGSGAAYLARLLEEESARLDYLEAGDRAVRVAIGLSYDALDPAARAVFRLLAAAPGAALTGAELGHCRDAPAFRQERLLNRLADRSLAWQEVVRLPAGDVTATFGHWDLVRLFALERLAEEHPPDEVEEFRRRSVAYLGERLREITDGLAGAQLSGELDPGRFHAALDLAAARGWLDLATDLAVGLHVLYSSRGELDAEIDVNRVRVALHLRRGEPAEAVRTCLLNAGRLRARGAAEAAGRAAREAVALAREHRLSGELLGEAEFAHCLALWDVPDRPGALGAGERAVAAFTAAGMGPAAATATVNTCRIAWEIGDLAAAERWGRAAIRLADRWSDAEHRGIALNALGRTLSRSGREAEAVDLFLRACAVWESGGRTWNAAVEYENAANAAQALGDLGEAVRLRLRAVDRWERADDPGRLTGCLIDLAAHHASAGDLAQAADVLERAARVAADPDAGVPDPLREETLVRRAAARLCRGDGPPDAVDPVASAADPEVRAARDALADHDAGRLPAAEATARLRPFLCRSTRHPVEQPPPWLYEDVTAGEAPDRRELE